MFLFEKMSLKKGATLLMENSVKFFTKYSDDILKIFGASALVVFLVKILKEIIAKNEKGKEEIQQVLDELEKEQKVTRELEKKIDALSEKYPILRAALHKGVQEVVDKGLDEQRKLTKELKEANVIWFATSNAVDKSDTEEILRIQQEVTLALYGMPDEDGVAQKVDPACITDEKTKNAYLTLLDFCAKYCEYTDDPIYLNDNELLDEERTNTDWLNYFVVENGVYFNFSDTVEITEELRKTFNHVLEALNVLVAEDSDSDVSGKYYKEYFLD